MTWWLLDILIINKGLAHVRFLCLRVTTVREVDSQHNSMKENDFMLCSK